MDSGDNSSCPSSVTGSNVVLGPQDSPIFFLSKETYEE
jgi:hypothetical protein